MTLWEYVRSFLRKLPTDPKVLTIAGIIVCVFTMWTVRFVAMDGARIVGHAAIDGARIVGRAAIVTEIILYFGLSLSVVATIGAAFLWRRQRLRESHHGRNRTVPPGLAESILAICTKKQHREAVIGDADEKYHANVKKFGSQRARHLYWIEVITSVGPLLWQATKRVAFVITVASRIFR